MAEEFVDLYEVIDLPVDTDRNTLRKRINELYLEAQRNLDHRTFATRVKYQELFEVTLPQARYILLDDGRRDDYDRMVHAYRGTVSATPGAPANAPVKTAPVVNPNDGLPGESEVTPLPANTIDPEQLAKEREELWKKWKMGLEDALSNDDATKPKPRAATTSNPASSSSSSSFSLQPEAPSATPAPSIQAKIQPAPSQPAAVQATTAQAASVPAPQAAAPKPAAPKTAAKPKISFDFEGKEAATAPAAATSTGGWKDTSTSELELSMAEIEQRRTEHRRNIMKEVLVNTGLVWGTIGALLVIVPGVAALVKAHGHYYPRVGQPLLKYNPSLLVGGASVIILVAAYFVSQALSKSMRRTKAQQYAALTYEDLLKKVGKS